MSRSAPPSPYTPHPIHPSLSPSLSFPIQAVRRVETVDSDIPSVANDDAAATTAWIRRLQSRFAAGVPRTTSA